MPFTASPHDDTRRRRLRFLALALGAVLVVTAAPQDAVAKKKKAKVTATIDGKKRKWSGKKVTVYLSAGSVNIVATTPHPRLNQLVPGVGVSCQVDLAGPFPVTPQFPQFCVLGYSEVRFSKTPNPEMWGGSNVDGAVVVTFESRDENRVTGTFHGVVSPQSPPSNPPVTIENGTFSIDIGGS